jgi:hypothetical protein
MARVSQEKLDAILNEIKKVNPDMQIIDRSTKGWQNEHWQLWLTWLGVCLAGLFNPSFKKRWEERYTIVTPHHIAFPKKPVSMRDYATYSILRHEYIHLKDRQKHPLWFPFSYLLVLPIGWTMRAHWELRGYTADMITYYEEFGLIPDRLLDHIEKQFTTDRYFWMWPNKKKVRARLEQIRKDIRSGNLSGFYF